MDEEPAIAEPSRYRAFISYSHADAKFAHWLHRKLESWRLPDKRRLAPVFIDRAELAAGSDLSAQVRQALSESAALVVVASPGARASRWVGQEIELFRTLHPDRPVLAALIEGEPDEAFPQALTQAGGREFEPLAADFRKGHDGKRLGLLKLVAGLSALPLDQLVQRDAQSRQRRVMAITAAAVLLVLVLSAALVIALRARAEAERQRAEAEGLVEFMLTDLRDKLKGVGRLDVMDAVNQRVLARYSRESASSMLPKDVLLRRARLFQMMAEDDLSSASRFEYGAEEAEASAGITGALSKRFPSDAETKLAHAKSNYWLGEAKFRDPEVAPNLRAERAMPYWLTYQRLTSDLAKRPDAQPAWLIEAAYADGNLCALALSTSAGPDVALKHCRSASAQLASARNLIPKDLDVALNLATAYAWEADANFAAGNSTIALRLRRSQVALVQSLSLQNPGDARVAEGLLLAEFGLAKTLLGLGKRQDAIPVLDRAYDLSKQLLTHDPGNRDWEAWQKKIADLKPK